MIKKSIIITITVLLSISCVFAQPEKLNIALFFESSISSLVITPDSGSYVIFADSSIIKLNNRDILYLSIDKDSLNVKTLDKVVGKFKHVKISGIDKINIFKIKPSDPDLA